MKRYDGLSAGGVLAMPSPEVVELARASERYSVGGVPGPTNLLAAAIQQLEEGQFSLTDDYWQRYGDVAFGCKEKECGVVEHMPTSVPSGSDAKISNKCGVDGGYSESYKNAPPSLCRFG